MHVYVVVDLDVVIELRLREDDAVLEACLIASLSLISDSECVSPLFVLTYVEFACLL